MQRLSLIAGVTALSALLLPATAVAQSQYGYGYNYNPPVQNVACERQRKDDKLAGALVGAVAGGLIGGAIGNNIDDGDAYRHRGHRGYRGYNGYRGYGHNGGHRHGNGNSDEVAVGAILGALVGGVAGSAIAADTARPCHVATPYSYASGGNYAQAGIPRTTDGLYGGPEVMGQPSYPNTPPPSRTYPASTSPGPAYPAYPSAQDDTQECRTTERETRMPDGQVLRDPVTVCRYGQNGQWVIEDGNTDYNY